MATTSYLTVDQLKATLRIDPTNTRFDDLLQLAIDSASRQIDQHCDDQFWLADAPSPKLFQASHPRRLFTPSFANTAGLVVELDLDDDGTFETTWTEGRDFQVTPVAPTAGWPYRGLEMLGSAFLPTGDWRQGIVAFGDGFYGPTFGGEWWPRSQRARVRVTAQWGWPAVPPQVKQACSILATDHYKSKDVTEGASGVQGLSTGRFGSASHASVRVPGFNPMARELLCGLRELVIA